MTNLFDDVPMPPTREELEALWRLGYAQELLDKPPVRGLMESDPARGANARRYARQDLARAKAAAERMGLRIVLELSEEAP